MYIQLLATARIIALSVAVAGSYLVSTPGLASDWEEEVQGSSASQKITGSGVYLRGRVEHADKLPPLGDNLQAGSHFDAASMPAAKYGSSWFKIPAWFSGTFQAEQSVIDFVKDYATGRSVRPNKSVNSLAQEVHGFQKDAHGGIWHFYVKSGSSRSEQAGQMTINNIDWYGPDLVTNDRVVMRVQATSFIVDKRTGVIVDSFRREDIKTYSPGKNGELLVSYTSKSFDSHGQPRDLQDGHSVYKMLSPFQAIDSEGSQNYKQMLADFLSTPAK